MWDSCCFMNGLISLKPRDHSLSVVITPICFLIMNFGNSTDGLINQFNHQFNSKIEEMKKALDKVGSIFRSFSILHNYYFPSI